MICKKCGNNIADTSKFCGYCGEKVEEITLNTENITVSNSPVVENNVVENSVQPDLTDKVVVEQNQTEQLSTVNPIEQTVIVPPINQVQPSVNEPKKKKSYAWIFIVGGILLGVIAIVLLILAFSKSTNTSVRELERALNVISEKGENSGTVDAKVLIETDTSDTYNLTATVKYAKQYDDNYDIALTLNKSLLYDEMNLYATITDEDLTLFAQSSLIDMLGLTSSQTDMWVYFLMTEEELGMETETEIEEDEKFYLSNILDEKHYKLIGEENGLKHYQLTIDNELLNKIKAQAPSEEELREFEQSLSEINGGSAELTDVYYLDIYINSNGEIAKVSMDLTEELDDETIKKAVISFEFVNFGNTTVSIPNEAKSSMMDLETYMSTYTSFGSSTEDIGTDYSNNYDNYDDYMNGNYYNTDYYYGM